jgi:hypothetical protein
VRRLEHPVLRYDLFVSAEVVSGFCLYTNQFNDLLARHTELATIEIIKMPCSDRPQQYNQFKNGEVKTVEFKDKFSLPDTWTYYVDEVS